MSHIENDYTVQECRQAFTRLFPHGFCSDDIEQEITPEGWEHSELVRTFHPTAEQCYEERVRLTERLHRLSGKKRELPDLAQMRSEHVDTPIDREIEIAGLVGLCLWEVFSSNNEVVDSSGRLVDIGSFRGAARFLAEYQNAIRGTSFDYTDFYMGLGWVESRADVTPVFRMVFGRLKRHGFDWRYVFPRLVLVDVGAARPVDREDGPEWSDYDPGHEVTASIEEREREDKASRLRRDLEKLYHDSVVEARQKPPPRIIQAYSGVYGHFPHGWPPEVEHHG
jgi:hypothetical protein